MIVDANRLSLVFSTPRSRDHALLLDWITDKGGALVYGGTTYLAELCKVATAHRMIAQLLKAGRAFRAPDKLVDDESRIVAPRCTSNDAHIIALARVTSTRVLCSDDQALVADFKNHELVPPPKGAVFKDATHAHLLQHVTACPGAKAPTQALRPCATGKRKTMKRKRVQVET